MDVAGSLPKKIFPRLCPWENGNIYIWYATAEPYSELQVRRSTQPSQLSSACAALYFHTRTGLFRFPARRLAEKTATGSVTPPFSRSQHYHIINTNSVATSGCELLAFTAPRKNTDRFRDGWSCLILVWVSSVEFHSRQILSLSMTDCIVSVHRLISSTLLTLGQGTSKGSRRPISLMRPHTQ